VYYSVFFKEHKIAILNYLMIKWKKDFVGPAKFYCMKRAISDLGLI